MTDCLDTHRTELVLSTVVSGAFVTMMNGLYTRRPCVSMPYVTATKMLHDSTANFAQLYRYTA